MEEIKWKVYASQYVQLSEINFWNALNIWNTRPNIVDKRIFGVDIINQCESNDLICLESIKKELENMSLNEIKEYFSKLKSNNITWHKNYTGKESNSRYHIFIKTITFKRKERSLNPVEVAYFDRYEKIAVFFQLHSCESSRYAIRYKNGSLEILLPQEASCDQLQADWYKTVLLEKLSQWCQSECQSVPSLALVSIDQYKTIYSALKSKYVSSVKEIWSEVTDPDKFIHEDVAIATYLLLLWKGEKQRFVDLGCGNGLLVYILNEEGHDGVGYDVRPRQIWSKYPPSTRLEVCAIQPSKQVVFEDTDWLIGNHSDELTPWIPVIATYSSYKCNFFLLPCCPYEFNGFKYRRKNSAKSQYSDYIDYIENMCKTIGFNTYKDKLRIPSTKRTCLFSEGRMYSEDKLDVYKAEVDSLIEACEGSNGSEDWKLDVKIRGSREKVSNCTQLDAGLKETIVELVSGELLQGTATPEWNRGKATSMEQLVSEELLQGTVTPEWNKGKATSMEQLVQVIPKELLKQLKRNSKGLQTFLKNHHHIFSLEDGLVTFRKPEERQVQSTHWKKKPCWFFNNHPNSCPLSNDKCTYQHNL